MSSSEHLISNETDIYTQWIYPIAMSITTSIIASFAFFLIVYYFPEKKRKSKLRQKTDYEFNAIKNKLSSLFDGIMRRSLHSNSDYQSIINSGKLTLDDLKIGLQNKCINESYKEFKLYNEISPYLVSIYEPLETTKSTVNELINRLLILSQYLSTYEILFLEKIRAHLTTQYPFNNLKRLPDTKIGIVTYYDMNTTLYNSAGAFFELYKLYVELKYHVYFKNSYSDWGVDISRIGYLYHSKQYRLARKYISKAKKEHAKFINLLDMYLFQTLYKEGNNKNAYKLLIDILNRKDRLQLVYQRTSLKDFVEDKQVERICIENCSQKEYDEMLKVIKSEKQNHLKFIETSMYLKSFFETKKNEKITNNTNSGKQ